MLPQKQQFQKERFMSTHSRNVSRQDPACIIFLLDQSYSMTEGMPGDSRQQAKSEVLALAVNRFLSEIITRCERGEDKPRNYFDIAVIGYTTDMSSTPIIGSSFQGDLAGRELVSVEDLHDRPLELKTLQKDDGVGGMIEVTLPIWIQETAIAGTPMCGALQKGYEVAEGWIQTHRSSFPPVVIHITDGESSDGDPTSAAERLRSLETDDGNLLLFNCHLSSSNAQEILFPTDISQMPDDYARLLFNMSSPLPEKLRSREEIVGQALPEGARGMVLNADSVALIKLINVGTALADPSNLR